jgi:FdrA protein
MSATVINEVRPGLYLDSVALMRHSRAIAGIDGVAEAALMMGTPANKRIMADADLLDAAGEAAAGGDLIIGICAANADAAANALGEARKLLDQPAASGDGADAWTPRTIRAAVRMAPGSNLALISVPGPFAAAEARKAIRRGLHAMIFSDNVDLADEVALKQEGHDLGRLVMGPDCGTAIINGVPLAFANRVPRGDVGIIGASGTGTQEVSCLIAQGNRGISQAIGVGGRDLREVVGGISTLMALEALDADPGTAHIVLVSKPPPEAVAARVLARIGDSAKSFTVCFIGAGDLPLPANATLATTLKAAAEHALGGRPTTPGFDPAALATPAPAGRPGIHGLFSGGTLCAEAQVILRAAGEAVASNAPIPGVPKLQEANTGHPMVDLGDDDYTRGKPHPMIDPTVRDDAIVQALRDPGIGAVLVDVVIGYGAHGDPAGHLARILADHRPADGPVIVASVTGTDDDPQDRTAQAARLTGAGVLVAPSNADAAALALACVRRDG